MTLFELYRQVVMCIGKIPDDEVFYKAVSYAINKRKRVEAREGIELDDEYLVEKTSEAVEFLMQGA